MDARAQGGSAIRPSRLIRLAGAAPIAAAVVLAAVLSAALASGPGGLGTATDGVLLDVSPLPVVCAAAAADGSEAACLLVRPLGEEAWRELATPIAGFEPVAGVGYRLLVRPRDDGGWEALAQLETVPLGDVRWRLESVGVAGERLDPLPESEPWLRVDASAGRLLADVGCNAIFAAAYPLAPGRITFGPAASTLMACPEPIMRQERLVLQALEGAERYDVDGDRLRLSGPGGALWLTPLLPPRPTAAGAVWDDGALACFDGSVAAAAASGEVWPSDPLQVTLTLITPWDAAQLDVRRRDAAPEGARYSVVSVEAGGFLDDAVAGYRRVVVLERLERGRWRVIAITDATRCGRGEALWIGPPELCP